MTFRLSQVSMEILLWTVCPLGADRRRRATLEVWRPLVGAAVFDAGPPGIPVFALLTEVHFSESTE